MPRWNHKLFLKQVISRTLAQVPQANITLFALEQGEGFSKHTTSGDAMVQVLDGEAEIEIGEQIPL